MIARTPEARPLHRVREGHVTPERVREAQQLQDEGRAAHECAVCLADSRDAGHAQWSRKCGACEAHYYCGEACEVAGLARHRGVECDALAALRSDTDDDDLKDQVAQTVRILADR